MEAVAFSPDDKYLVSLGGQDDNGLILWDVAKGAAISGAVASRDSSGATLCLAYFRQNSFRFATAGEHVIRVWDIDQKTMKMRPTDCQLGQVKRVFNAISIDYKDEFMYGGTSTGDVLQINVNTGLFVKAGPGKSKELLHGGVTAVKGMAKGGFIYVGTGSGTIAKLSIETMTIEKQHKVKGPITSLSLQDKTLIAATSTCDIFSLNVQSFEPKLLASNHDSPINDVCFPSDASEVFITASDNDVRVWNIRNHREVLRIEQHAISCKSVLIKNDGSSIITGWDDGTVRAFGPQTGQLQFVIHNVHKGAVTALAAAKKSKDGVFQLVTGGDDGQVRMWEISKSVQKLVLSLKEHKGTVTEIRMRNKDTECVSSCSDGSCILWDLARGIRIQILFGSTAFKSVKYFPDESQLLSCGSDGRISYWETFDGASIRHIESTVPSVSLNSIDVTHDGQHFVVGGSEKKIKIYSYESGTVQAIGHGHSSDIAKVVISPDQKKIVSVGTDGAIFIWKQPFEVGPALSPLV